MERHLRGRWRRSVDELSLKIDNRDLGGLEAFEHRAGGRDHQQVAGSLGNIAGGPEHEADVRHESVADPEDPGAKAATAAYGVIDEDGGQRGYR